MDNANSPEYLEKIKVQVIENLKRTAFAPSVQLTDVPRDNDEENEAFLDDLDEDENKDKRHTKRRFDQYIEKEGELYDSDDEEMNAANGIRRPPGAQKRRNRMDYRNLNNDAGDSGIDSGVMTPQIASSPDHDMGGDADVEDDIENLDAHDNASPSPPAAVNGSNAASNHQSPQQKAEDTDIPMEDTPMANASSEVPPAVDGLQNKTPPDSPHTDADAQPAPAQASATEGEGAGEDQAMEDAQPKEDGTEQGEVPPAAEQSELAAEMTS
jgi:histone deacetylase 1/2